MKSADKAGEIVGVRANVTQRSGGTTLSGIGPPGGLFLAGGFHRGSQPVLRVFDLHDAQLAEFACRDHFAGLANHRIAGVVVGDAKDQAGFAHELRKDKGVFDGRSERLVADHVDASIEEGFGRCKVEVIRRDDGDCVDAVGAPGFGGSHFRERCIGTVGRNV